MRASAFLGALALLGVGIALGMAVGSTLATSDVEDGAHDAVPAGAPSTATRDAATAPASAPAAPRTRVTASDPAVAAALATPAPSAKTGAGTITGFVRGPDGAPLAGVVLRAEAVGDDGEDDDDTPAAHPPAGTPPSRTDIEEELRELAARLRRQEASIRETTTDASGAYTLSELPAKHYQIEAWLVGWRMERARGERWAPVEVGGTCDFKARPFRTVTVSVLLPDGKPADAARVTWQAAGGAAEGAEDAEDDAGDSADWTPSSPMIDVEPGTYEFTASIRAPGASGRYRHWRGRWEQDESSGVLYGSEPTTATVGADAAQTITLRLTGKPGIQVKLVYATPEHPRAARIAALRLDGVASNDAAQLLGDGRVKSAWLDGGLEGTLACPEPGAYLVGVTFRGGFVGPSAVVDVGNGPVTHEIRIPAGEIRETVKVWVRAPDGTPVRDAKLECGCDGSDGSGHSDVDLEPDADGSFRVPHYERDAPSLGGSSGSGGSRMGDGQRTYYVRATSARWGTVQTNYVPATDREVTVQLFEPAIVRLTIQGYAGSPDRDRTYVAIESRDADTESRRRSEEDGKIDASGNARFPPVRPGNYDVILRLARGDADSDRWNVRWSGAEVARMSVTLRAGENRLTLALPSLLELAVTYEGEVPDLVRVGPDGMAVRGGRDGVSGGEHEIRFRDIAPGRYRLVADETGDMFVDVTASARIAFRPRPFDCWHLRMREKGYLIDLGLKTGDLVVAIDGVEPRGKLALDAAMAAAKTRESVKFTIQRGGSRFDVTADGKRFEEDDGSLYQAWVR